MSGMLHGHHHKYSTELLNFFFDGINRFTKAIVFRALETMFSLSFFKGFISRIFITTRHYKRNSLYCFTFLLYSKECYYIMSSLFIAFMSSLHLTYKNFFKLYFVFRPKSGFLTSNARFESSSFIWGDLPLDVNYSRYLFLSFGKLTLASVTKELCNIKGSVSFGVVDSDQRSVLASVDYLLPGNDDSVGIAFTICTILLNSIQYSIQCSSSFY